MKKQWINYIVLLLLVPICIWIGVTMFDDRKYVFLAFVIMSFLIVRLTIMPCFLAVEVKDSIIRYMVVIAVRSAFSVLARFLLAGVAVLEPVAALVMQAATYFGAEAGLLVGVHAALICD